MNIIYNIREDKKNSEKKYNEEILNIENIPNHYKDIEKNENNKIEYTKKSINKIKMEFHNMIDDIELLNTNNNGKYIQKEIFFENFHKDKKDNIEKEDDILPKG